jgi:branched-chain amino acid transport system ATP-binding protein
MALSVAHAGTIMENGKIVLESTVQELRDNEDVREFCLGQGGEQRHFKNLKSYRRRKRWL